MSPVQAPAGLVNAIEETDHLPHIGQQEAYERLPPERS